MRQNHKALSQNAQALQLNNEELEMTRQELSESKDALNQQAITLEKQRFEGTFFQLINLHQQAVESMTYSGFMSNHEAIGRECFKDYKRIFNSKYEDLIRERVDVDNLTGTRKSYEGAPKLSEFPSDKVDEAKTDLKLIKDAYNNFYKSHEEEIGHYFRGVNNIVKFIDSSNQENKRLYSNILRAQLTTSELFLLFYNCLSDTGEKTLKPLVEEYSLLKAIPKNVLLSEHHLKFYEKSAF